MSRSWAKGSTPQWRTLRQHILQRDQYQCQIQLPDTCTGIADQVHHTKGKAVTGDDPNYLTSSCKACNLSIGCPTQRKHDPKARPTTTW